MFEENSSPEKPGELANYELETPVFQNTRNHIITY